MDLIFTLVPTLIACGALAMGFVVVRRSLRLRAAWRGGLTAEARCLRAYTTRSGGDHPSTTQHHVYEFTARDGRTVRIDEPGGPAMTVQGDVVLVHYTAEHPEHATAHAPRPFANLAGTVLVLAVLAVVVAFCVFFVSGAGDMPTDDF
ncbi:hypothetical protein G3I40_16065 [Streptomyces sp. SID14478]|uniref:DUF3592 domain-containing protein n=1 Tax=Streptomyces sp. SID14478 TaxID=2706073 RepID=UPI0013DB6AAF|nr:DUF3592 domain-containing protein [Streptomyces sp. SID14478]NEB76726.1 hypothetical protein [Streptomyces sp. SID14478]